jgi:hypothetical protein
MINFMAKENKGGNLTNDQIEQDLKAKGKEDTNGRLQGSQDTGDQTIRHLGNEVQRNDGMGTDNSDEE